MTHGKIIRRNFIKTVCALQSTNLPRHLSISMLYFSGSIEADSGSPLYAKYFPLLHPSFSLMISSVRGHLKGAIFPFDFRKFLMLEQVEGIHPSPIIHDAWGHEHNIIKEDIQFIFTASQLKMWRNLSISACYPLHHPFHSETFFLTCFE